MYLLFSNFLVIRQLVLQNMYECAVLCYLKGFPWSACILGFFWISFSLPCHSACHLQFPTHISADSVTEELQDKPSTRVLHTSLLLAHLALQWSNSICEDKTKKVTGLYTGKQLAAEEELVPVARAMSASPKATHLQWCTSFLQL